MSLLLSGCGPVPQPFRVDPATKNHNPILFPAEGMGISVAPIDGPVDWVGAALADAMATSLREREVAASSRARNQLSLRLSSQGYREASANGPARLVIEWRLATQEGRELGRRTDRLVPPAAFWHAPDEAMFREIAEAGAPAVVAWLRPYLIGSRLHGPLTVAIAPIQGAPGDGNEALHTALRVHLHRRQVALSDSLERAEVTVYADVSIKPADKSRDKVRVSWQLLTRDGELLATLDQENFVPAGRLSGRWGGIANAAAEGAAGGVISLLKQLRRARNARGTSQSDK